MAIDHHHDSSAYTGGQAVNDAVDRAAPEAIAADDQKLKRHARLAGLLRKGLQRFVGNVASVLTSEDRRAIHDLRVCSRRVQQILVATYGETLPRRARAIRRRMRRTRRAVGEWRSYDVVIAMLESRLQRARDDDHRRAWSIVLKCAEQARHREIRRARRRLTRLNVFGIKDTGALLIESGASRHLPTDTASRNAIAKAHDRWCEAYATAESGRAEDIHAFRIRTKGLRYRIELARELGTADTKPLIEWFKKLQDDLGRWRDRIELARIIASSIADPERLLTESRASIILLTELERILKRAGGEIQRQLDAARLSPGFAQCNAWVRLYVSQVASPQADNEAGEGTETISTDASPPIVAQNERES
ncbi:MAG: CHAD domain-containing protein [Candidatus Binataceae bacterium]|nr:CHAD domain-containing protein [Candidatus Binataceae bacterium]